MFKRESIPNNGKEIQKGSRLSVESQVRQSVQKSAIDQIVQRAAHAPKTLRPADILQLQRSIGNRATERILQRVLDNKSTNNQGELPTRRQPQLSLAIERSQSQVLQRYEWEQTATTSPASRAFHINSDAQQIIQRAPGLPTKNDLRGKGLKPGKKLIGTQTWADLEKALDEYREIDDQAYDAQKLKLAEIQNHIDSWKMGHLKDGFVKKKKEQGKYDELLSIEVQIQECYRAIEMATAPPEVILQRPKRDKLTPPPPLDRGVGVERRRRENVFQRPQPELETPIGEKIKQALKLVGDYKEDRNYFSWGGGALPHVGWKAHVGANSKDRLPMATAISTTLQQYGVFHKFDISNGEGTIEKYITIYPPEEEESWLPLIKTLEPLLAEFASVSVTHDMPVGETGQIFMRHGQNTPLTMDLLLKEEIELTESGSIGPFKRYTGDAVAFDELPLLAVENGPFFFNKSGETLPEELNPNTVYMAILFNGKIVPDRRESPNPANASMPAGVSPYVDDL